MAIERKVTVKVNVEATSNVGQKLAEERRKAEQFAAAVQRGRAAQGAQGGAGLGIVRPAGQHQQQRQAFAAAVPRQQGAALALPPARQAMPALFDPAQPPRQRQTPTLTAARQSEPAGSPVEKQWGKAVDELREWRAKVAVSSSGMGGRIMAETAALEEQFSVVKKLREESGKLDFYRTTRGRQVLMEQARVMREQGRAEDYAKLTAERGRVGAALGTFAERGAPVFGAARTAAMVGGGIMAAGVASLPAVSEQLSGSFGMLSREIGIAVTPDMVRLSGVAQSAARGVRWLNESTNGAAGRLLFLGTTAATAVAGIGATAESLSRAAQGAKFMYDAGGAIVNLARGPGSSAALNAGANFLGSAAGNVGSAAVGRAATGTAAGAVGRTAATAGGGLLGAGLLTNPVTGPIVAAIVGTIGGIELGTNNAAINQQQLESGGISRSAGITNLTLSHLAGPLWDFIGRPIVNATTGSNMESHMARNYRHAGSWVGLTTQDPRGTSAIGRLFGGGSGQPQEALFDRKGAFGEIGSHYDEMVLRQYQGSDAEREQNARAQAKLSESLDNLNTTIQQSFPPPGLQD